MDKKGSIFIITMWTVLFLSILAVSIGKTAHMRIKFSGAIENRNNIYHMINSGIDAISGEIILESLKEPVLLFPYVVKKAKDEQLKLVRAMDKNINYNYSFDVFEGQLFLKVSDEQSKININNIGYDVLKRIIKDTSGLDEEQAQEISYSIIDWVDEDNERPLVKVVSNEDLYYKLDNIPYKPKNDKFEAVEELLLIKGMTTNVYEGIEKYITVYGNGKVNINTCSDVVLKNIVNDKTLFDKIKSFRTKYSNDVQNLFDNDRTITKKLKENMGLQPEQEKILQELVNQGIIGVDTNAFRVTGIAVSKNFLGEVDCVVDDQGNRLFFFEDFISI
ncbi:MAG: type II secretion system protein GspK [Candidatus Omnitrophica bacterium]|nr:type II secretion system protein GspK [Candidatus Omnitrophota bacterium]